MFWQARQGLIAGRAALDAAGAFDPSSLSNLALWIDPSDLTTLFQSNAGSTAVTADGDPVGYASDKSGTSYHLNSNADDTTRPTYKDQSSIKYIDFDGSNDALKRLANLGLYNNNSCSIFMAVKSNPATNTTMLFEGGTSANTLGAWIMNDASTASTVKTIIRDDAAGAGGLNNTWGASNSGFDNTWHVLGFTWDGTTLTPYVNGKSTVTRSLASGLTLTTNRFAIGCRYRGSDGLQNFGAMSLAGLICTKSSLGGTDLANVKTWLGNKVGLSL